MIQYIFKNTLLSGGISDRNYKTLIKINRAHNQPTVSYYFLSEELAECDATTKDNRP